MVGLAAPLGAAPVVTIPGVLAPLVVSFLFATLSLIELLALRTTTAATIKRDYSWPTNLLSEVLDAARVVAKRSSQFLFHVVPKCFARGWR
jgi:hypothetical protein